MASRLRGFQVNPERTSEDLSTAANVYKVNLIRCQINLADDATLKDQTLYKNWVISEVQKLVSILSFLDNKVKVVLDIHQAPGGRDIEGNNPMFTDQRFYQEWLLDVWKTLAIMLKDNPVIYVYGILNEPVGPAEVIRDFMRRAVETIRKVDKKKRISITCPWGTPDHFNNMPLFKNDKNIWYEVHMYYPTSITHQGVYGHPFPVVYPHKPFVYSELVDYLQKVRRFQLKYNVPIYVGEFSISIYAPIDTRVRYLTDVIKTFEEYSWRWTYHAFRESPIWDFEAYPPVAALLQSYWNKNVPV